MDTTIKAGTWCPICRGMVLQDCHHRAEEFNCAYARRTPTEREKYLATALFKIVQMSIRPDGLLRDYGIVAQKALEE